MGNTTHTATITIQHDSLKARYAQQQRPALNLEASVTVVQSSAFWRADRFTATLSADTLEAISIWVVDQVERCAYRSKKLETVVAYEECMKANIIADAKAAAIAQIKGL